MCRRLCGDISCCCLDFQAALISPRSCATHRTSLYPSTSSGVEYTLERTFVCFIKNTIDRMSLQSFTRTTLCWLAPWIVLSHVVSAQSLRADDPCLNAEAYGSRETSSCLWFGVGFCLPFAGPISSYIIKPDPPASAVVGKSSAYVELYADCYKSGAISNQSKWAWIGTCSCILAIPVALAVSCVTGIGSLSMGPG